MNAFAHRLISNVAVLGPRNDGPRNDGPRNDGPRNDGPRATQVSTCDARLAANRVALRGERAGGERNPRRAGRRGTTLLLCLFVMFFTSLVLVGLLQSVRLQVAQQRATMEYERANYLAGAAVNHAMTLLEANIDWRGEIAETPFADGSDETYAASVANEVNGGVLITARGTSGSITRRLQVIVE